MSFKEEKIKEYFITLIKNNIKIKIKNNSITCFINDINDINHLNINIEYFANDEFYYDINMLHYNSIIFDSLGYPWNYSFQNILKSYLNNIIEWSDVERYMELQILSINKLNEIKKQEEYKLNGTPKFKEAFEKLCQLIINECNIMFKNNKIEKFFLSDKYDKTSRAVFIFKQPIKYIQKKHLIKTLQTKFNKKYDLYKDKNIKQYSINDIFGGCSNLIRLIFTDSSKITKNVNGFIILVKANNWNGLAMDEMSQFVPKM